MNLQELDPSLLSPNPWNTNSVAPEEMEKLKASLSRHGWVRPVIVRETSNGLEILGGQHRVEAAIDLEHDTIPVINLGDISDVEAKEIGLIDNARYGHDDAIALAELLEGIGGAHAVATFLPFSDGELAALSTSLDDDDIDDLLEGLDQEEGQSEEPAPRPTKTHQIMRFKVPIADADEVQNYIEKVMEDQGFTEADSLTNAGDALVSIVSEALLNE